MHMPARTSLSHLDGRVAGGKPASSWALLTVDSRQAALPSSWRVLIWEALPATNRVPIHCRLGRVTEHFTTACSRLTEIRFTKSYIFKDRFFKIPFPSLSPVPNPHILVIGPGSSVAKLSLDRVNQDQ